MGTRLFRALAATVALALLTLQYSPAQSIGNGPGSIYTQSCGSGALAGGQFCNETGSSAPANNCTIGAMVVLLGNGAIYVCTAANTWTQLASGTSYSAGVNIILAGTTFSLTQPLTGCVQFSSGSTPTCTTSGRASFNDGASSGEIVLGGSTANGALQFGEHNIGTFAFSGGHSVDFGDQSGGLLRIYATSTDAHLYASNDALNANIPLTLAGLAGAQGSTLNLKFSSTIATGPIQAASVSAGTTSYIAPVYNHSGAAVASTIHCVTDTVTAAGASTSVTLTSPAAFASGAYWLNIWDTTSLVVATVTAQSSTGFTFTSINTDAYYYNACGP
jgi:hypothetical protein